MNDKKTLIAVAALILSVFAIIGGADIVRNVGVPMAESMNATTTSSADASATASYVACIGKCQLGSIVVTQVGTAGWVRVWDATTTATSTYVEPTPFSSSTYAVAVGRPIAQITGASDVAGTYTFNTDTYWGLVVETSTGFDGQYQVLWTR